MTKLPTRSAVSFLPLVSFPANFTSCTWSHNHRNVTSRNNLYSMWHISHCSWYWLTVFLWSQGLHFLVRDWSYGYEFENGVDGGEKYLQKTLMVKPFVYLAVPLYFAMSVYMHSLLRMCVRACRWVQLHTSFFSSISGWLLAAKCVCLSMSVLWEKEKKEKV